VGIRLFPKVLNIPIPIKRTRGRPLGSGKKKSPSALLSTAALLSTSPSPTTMALLDHRSSRRDLVVRTFPISEEVSIERKAIVSSFTSLSREEIFLRLAANPPPIIVESEQMSAGYISYDISPLLEQRRDLLQKLDQVSFEVNEIVYKEFCSLRRVPVPKPGPPPPRELEKVSEVVKDILTYIYK